MSVAVIARVIWTTVPDLDATHRNGTAYRVSGHVAKLALIALADSADDFGENSYNSFDTIKTKTCLQRRSVPRVVRALEQNGWCFYKGLSAYGTNNYSVNMDKLAHPPEKRARAGRPKTSDSSSLSEETSDSSSRKGYQSHPNLIKDNNKYASLVTMYESTIGLVDGIFTAQMLQEDVDTYPLDWFEAALKIAVENNARNWKYVRTILKGWKEHYYGWKPGDRGRKEQLKEKKPIQPKQDDDREMTPAATLIRPKIGDAG